MSAPIPYRWTGDAFEPLPRFRAECDNTFVVGAIYRLEEVQDRSLRSHNHEFAWLAEAWRNLPESLAEAYPTPEHLRKRGLIEAGYFDETMVDVGTKAGAVRMKSMLEAIDDFALVFVRGPFVIRRTAKSQSRRAMGAKDFQESKTALLDKVADMLGISADELRRQKEAA